MMPGAWVVSGVVAEAEELEEAFLAASWVALSSVAVIRVAVIPAAVILAAGVVIPADAVAEGIRVAVIPADHQTRDRVPAVKSTSAATCICMTWPASVGLGFTTRSNRTWTTHFARSLKNCAGSTALVTIRRTHPKPVSAARSKCGGIVQSSW